MKRHFFPMTYLAITICMASCKNSDSTFNREPEIIDPIQDSTMYFELLRDGEVILSLVQSNDSASLVPADIPEEPGPEPTVSPNDSVPIFPFYLENSTQDSILKEIVLLRDGLILPFDIDIDDDDNNGPDPYNINTYVSYINKNDRDSRHYYDTKEFRSPIYACRYGSKGHPMVYAEFYIEGWYASKRNGDNETILYVPYIKTIITDAHKGFTMHLEGTAAYNDPQIRVTSNGEYAVIGSGEVEIKYGDSWKVERVGKLKFTIDGEIGFQEVSWNYK